MKIQIKINADYKIKSKLKWKRICEEPLIEEAKGKKADYFINNKLAILKIRYHGEFKWQEIYGTNTALKCIAEIVDIQ